MYKCKYCSKEYDHKSSKFTHQKVCPRRNAVPIEIKAKTKPAEPQTVNNTNNTNNTNNVTNNITNSGNVTNVYIVVNQTPSKDLDVYKILKEQLGQDGAVNLLNGCLSLKDPMAIIKELFMKGVPDDHTVACDGHEFRYLDGEKVVNDDGTKIIPMMLEPVQKAMILAVNDVIIENVKGGTLDMLYDVYDIGGLQRNLIEIGGKKVVSNVKTEFTGTLRNPDHKFFKTKLDASITATSCSHRTEDGRLACRICEESGKNITFADSSGLYKHRKKVHASEIKPTDVTKQKLSPVNKIDELQKQLKNLADKMDALVKLNNT